MVCCFIFPSRFIRIRNKSALIGCTLSNSSYISYRRFRKRLEFKRGISILSQCSLIWTKAVHSASILHIAEILVFRVCHCGIEWKYHLVVFPIFILDSVGEVNCNAFKLISPQYEFSVLVKGSKVHKKAVPLQRFTKSF